MKTKILTTALVLIISCSMAFAQSKTIRSENQSDTTKMGMAKDSVYFTCPMHPEVISAKPGKCPKCGMNLIQKTIKATVKTEAIIVYTCPMHPEVLSEKPGKCPKCGMDLIVKK